MQYRIKRYRGRITCPCGGSFGTPPFSCLKCRVTVPAGWTEQRRADTIRQPFVAMRKMRPEAFGHRAAKFPHAP